MEDIQVCSPLTIVHSCDVFCAIIASRSAANNCESDKPRISVNIDSHAVETFRRIVAVKNFHWLTSLISRA